MVLASIFLVLSIGVTWLFLPKLANHFTFALPVPNGLPYHISYNNRTYLNNAVCAGENWCEDKKPQCRTQPYLIQNNEWPLKQVGEVPTLFGPAHPILMPIANPGLATTVVYVQYGDGCY